MNEYIHVKYIINLKETYIHKHTHICIWVHIHTCKCICVYIHSVCICRYMYVCILYVCECSQSDSPIWIFLHKTRNSSFIQEVVMEHLLHTQDHAVRSSVAVKESIRHETYPYEVPNPVEVTKHTQTKQSNNSKTGST